jgi:putative transposase
MAMLEDVRDLSLARLNEATQAWVEYEYNRKRHSEIAEAPIARFLAGPSVLRPCPDSAALKLAFTRSERRALRKSDGTILIERRRFEVPNRYRHLVALEVRFALWDLGLVHLVDEHTGTVLCRLFPQDKAKNANGLRRSLEPLGETHLEPPRKNPTGAMAPLLDRLVETQAASGLPPAYLVKDEEPSRQGEEP